MPTNGALSYSSVRTYLECALRWKFLYIDKIPETPRGYFSFGRTVHSVLEDLLRPLILPASRRTASGDRQKTLDEWPGSTPRLFTPPIGRLMTPEELLADYNDHWVGEGYNSAEEEARYRALGMDLLTSYREAIVRAPPAPVSVEEHLEATWDGIPVHGYLDRIDRTTTGGLEIIDYKTSRELRVDDARESDQLSLYQVLVEKNYAEPVDRLTLYHLRGKTPLTVPRRDPGALEQLHGRVGRAQDGIRGASYEPSPGRHCSRCEFKSLCPEFRTVPVDEQERLVGLVDRFQRLRSEETRLEGELRTTAEELHKAAESLGVHRIPGSGSVALRRRDEVWKFRAASVGPVLADHGLSDSVRSDDSAAIQRLVDSPTTDSGLRRRLTESGGRQVRWYWELEDGASGA